MIKSDLNSDLPIGRLFPDLSVQTQHISSKEARAISTQTFYHSRYSKQLILIFPLYLDNYVFKVFT